MPLFYTALREYPAGPAPERRRIVVVPDVHADLDAARACLRAAGVLDGGDGWTGGDTVVVQLGDQVDGKPRSATTKPHPHVCGESLRCDLEVMGFFNRLHSEAKRQGGAVYGLLGNHEVMNVLGAYDYVDDDGCAACAARRTAVFAPGRFGARLLACTRAAVLRLGRVCFAHAGLLQWHLDACDDDVFALNDAAYAWLMGYALTDMQHRILKGVLLHGDGPLWTRAYRVPEVGGGMGMGMGMGGDRSAAVSDERDAEVQRMLGRLGCRSMVVGHNAHAAGATELHGGRVTVLDPGMSHAVMGGAPMALELLQTPAGARRRLIRG